MAPQPVVDNAATTRRTHIIRTVLAVLVIAPLSIAAFYMWALWDPGDTVNRLPVAIVNADAGTELDGTRLQAGDEVVAALVESGDVAWKVVSEQEAADGVNDGTYYFSVVIPKTFSADVASAASGSGRKAELDVLYNDYNSLVAGPVGEALIMTALGLVVAVPAVLAYNWLIRRNKSIMEDLAAFTNDLHGYIMSNGSVKPRMGPAVSPSAQTRSAGAPTQPGSEPLRTGQTQSGAQATPTTAK